MRSSRRALSDKTNFPGICIGGRRAKPAAAMGGVSAVDSMAPPPPPPPYPDGASPGSEASLPMTPGPEAPATASVSQCQAGSPAAGRRRRALQLGLTPDRRAAAPPDDAFSANQSWAGATSSAQQRPSPQQQQAPPGPLSQRPGPLLMPWDTPPMRRPKTDQTLIKGDTLFSFSFNGATTRSPYRYQQRASDAAGRSLNDSWAFYKSFAPPETVTSQTLFITPTKSVFTIDSRTSQILMSNEMATDLLGYSGAELSCMRLKDLFVSSESRPRMEEAHLTSRGGVVVFAGNVVEVSTKSGEVVPVSLWLRKIETNTADRRCVAVLEPVQRKTVQMTCDRFGRIVDVFGSVSDLFSLQEEDFIALKVFHFLPALRLPDDLTDIHKDERVQEVTAKRPDGSSFPVSVRISIEPSSPTPNPMLRIRVHAYTSLMGLVVMDEDLRVCNYNRNFISLAFGYQKSALVGKDIRDLIPTFDEDMEMLDSDDESLSLPPIDDDELIIPRYSGAPTTKDAADSTGAPSVAAPCVGEASGAEVAPPVPSQAAAPASVSNLSSEAATGETEASEAVAGGDALCARVAAMAVADPPADPAASAAAQPREQARPAKMAALEVSRTESPILGGSDAPAPARQPAEGDERACDQLCSGGGGGGPLVASTPGHPRAPPPRRPSLRDNTYYGVARHRDGSEFNITYDLCTVALDDDSIVYCLWIGQDRSEAAQSSLLNGDSTAGVGHVSLGQAIQLQAAAAAAAGGATAGGSLDAEDAEHCRGEYSRYYTTVQQIGNGAFGFVKLGYRNGDRMLVVTKFIKKNKVHADHWVQDQSLDRRVPLEVSLLSMLHHPNIIRVLDVYENEQYLQMVMERHGSMDLFDFIDREPALDEPLASHIFRQICAALSHLHTLEILHRDVKDENVIIDSTFHIKLIDFGSATFVSHGQLLNTFCGTVEYCAPEVLLGNKYDGYMLEMWSLGVTLFTLLCGENPFHDVEDSISKPLRLPPNISPALSNLLTGLLEKSPHERLRLVEVCAHPWTTQPVDATSYHFQEVVSCSGAELNPPRFLTPAYGGGGGDSDRSGVSSATPPLSARKREALLPPRDHVLSRHRVHSDETMGANLGFGGSTPLHQSLHQ